MLDKLDQLTRDHEKNVLDITEAYNKTIEDINANENEAISEHTPQVSDFILINSLTNESLTITKKQLEDGNITGEKFEFDLLSFERFIVTSTAGEASTAPPMFGELPIGEPSKVFEVRNVG